MEIKKDLISSGFVPKVEKCTVQSLQFLGSNIDSKEDHLTIPETRIEKVLKVLNEINSDLKARGKVFVKKVASFWSD